MLPFGSVDSELREIELAGHQRAAHARRVAEADPELAQRISSLARAYPWVKPGALWSLGRSGAHPGAELAREIARRSAVSASRRAFTPVGQTVKTGTLKGRAKPDAIRRIGMKESVRFAESRALGSKGMDLAPDQRYAEATELQALLGIKYPGTDPEVLWAMAAAGMKPGTPESDAVAAGHQQPPARDRTAEGIEEITSRPARSEFSDEEMETLQRSAARTLTKLYPEESKIGAPPLVPVARAGFMALSAPGQELQGLFRNVVDQFTSFEDPAAFAESQSDLGISAERLLRGEPVDVGSGFFVDPESDIAKERLERELERGDIGGHAITLGRWVGSGLGLDPDTRAFNIVSGLVDAGVAIKADPSALILSKAGAVRGLRSVVQPEKVDAWLAGPGRKVVDYLAGEKNWDRMWRTLEKKVPVPVINRLVDADSAAEVTAILRDELGTAIREFPTLPMVNRPGFTKKGYVRLAQLLPSSRVDLNDIDDAVEQMDRVAKTFKLPADRVAHYTERMGRAAGDRYAQRDVLFDLMTEAQMMVRVDGSKAKQVTKLFLDSLDDTRKFFVNAKGENVDFPGAVVDAQGVVKAQPHLYDEVLGRFVELPDPREARRATAKFANVLTSDAWEVPVAAMDFLVGSLWKTAVLFRAAYAVRVLGEEQFRMAAAGLDSMFSHPMSYIAYLTGRKGGADVVGRAWDDIEQFKFAMTRGSAGWKDPSGFHRSRHWMVVNPGEDHYVASWADELSQLAADPIATRAVDDIDATKDWFWNGGGAHLRNDLLRDTRFDPLRARAGADGYIDSVLERVMIKTAGDSRLLDAVRTGRLNGAQLTEDGFSMSRSFVKELQSIHQEGIDAGKVKGRIPVSRGRGTAEGATRVIEAWDNATERFFGFLMGKRTNQLSRSKTFEQMYWSRMQELSPYLDAKSWDRMNRQAAALKVSLNSPLKTAATRTINLDEADLLAKGYALDEVRKLLYDLTERGQAEDAFRLIFPFGGAWKEMVTRWFHPTEGLLSPLGPRPQTLRRLQQGIEGARDVGFFYKDPVTGDEVFNYPGSAFFNERTAGIPVPLTGRVQGLSLMTEVLPGFGPMVQVPASYFIPETPEWDSIREVVLPFGPVKNPADVRSWLPIWMQRAIAPTFVGSAEQQSMYASTHMDVANYLLSTGRYDIHGPDAEDEMDRLMRDAKKAAKKLYWVRAAAQTTAPAAPTPQWIVEDRNGNVALLGVMRDDWIKMIDEHDGDSDAAVAEFIDLYGEDAFAVMQGKSYAVVFGVPVTKEADRWVRANKRVKEKFPFTFGYFAPQGGEFDSEAYRRSFEEGSRDRLSVEQWGQLANHRIASYLYRKEAEAFGTRPTDEQRRWLGELKGWLKERYPGYERAIFGLPQRAEPEQVIDELTRASKDPTLRKTDTGIALREYLIEREAMADTSEQRGFARSSFATAQANRDLRDYLRELGEFLSEEHPDFRSVWEGVLYRELNEDIEDVQVAA